MTDALAYFLDEETVCAEVDFPDRGIDFAFMLKPADWKALLKKWDDYSDEWKNAISYFAGFAYLEDSAVIILKALYEKNEKIVLQALLSIYESMNAQIESEGHKRKQTGKQPADKAVYTFSVKDRQKIQDELALRNKEFDVYPELKQLQYMITRSV